MSLPTAAARVFAVPELLEQIIVLVNTSSRRKESYWNALEGIKSQFILQRVSHGFMSTILGSKLIQSSDWIRYKSTETPEYHLRRLAWFSYVSGLFRLDTFLDPAGIKVYANQYKDARFDDRQEASWRGLKCLPDGFGEVAFDVRIKRPVQCECSPSCGHGLYDCYVEQVGTWHLDGTYTLGQFYDELEALIRR